MVIISKPSRGTLQLRRLAFCLDLGVHVQVVFLVHAFFGIELVHVHSSILAHSVFNFVKKFGVLCFVVRLHFLRVLCTPCSKRFCATSNTFSSNGSARRNMAVLTRLACKVLRSSFGQCSF